MGGPLRGLIIDREPGSRVTPPTGSDWFYDGWHEPHLVTATDLRTGGTRWTGRLEPGASWVLPGVRPYQDGVAGGGAAESWMAVLDPSGHIDIWDLASGKVRVRGDLGPFDAWSYAMALPDVLTVSTQDDLEPVLTGYDPRTFARLWRVRAPDIPDASGVAGRVRVDGLPLVPVRAVCGRSAQRVAARPVAHRRPPATARLDGGDPGRGRLPRPGLAHRLTPPRVRTRCGQSRSRRTGRHRPDVPGQQPRHPGHTARPRVVRPPRSVI